MHFTMSSTSRLMAMVSCLLVLSTLLLSVTAAPIDSSNANLLDARSSDQPAGGVAGVNARIAARADSSSTRSAQDDAAPEEPAKPTWSLKGLMKRTPEPKRFTLDDFTTIAAANEKYDGLRPEGAGFVGLKQRGLPGWSRIF